MRAKLAELHAALKEEEGKQKDDSPANVQQDAAHEDHVTTDAPQTNGVTTNAADEASVDEPADTSEAQNTQHKQALVEKIEQLESELSKLVIANDDKARYARSNSSSRW